MGFVRKIKPTKKALNQHLDVVRTLEIISNGDEESRTPVQISRHLQIYVNSLST